jgi:hypothetical protein
MALIKIGDYANGTIIDRDEWVAELSNIYDTWNGDSIINDVHHKFSGANPGIIIDQIGAGLIQDNRKSGLSVCPIANDGKITSPNVIVKKASWFVRIVPVFPFGEDDVLITNEYDRHFIVPSGVSIKIKKFSLLFKDIHIFGGGSTMDASTNLTFKIVLNGSNIGNGVRIGGSNLNINTEYSEDLNVGVSSGDKIRILPTTFQFGGLDGLSITALMEWEQRLG